MSSFFVDGKWFCDDVCALQPRGETKGKHLGPQSWLTVLLDSEWLDLEESILNRSKCHANLSSCHQLTGHFNSTKKNELKTIYFKCQIRSVKQDPNKKKNPTMQLKLQHLSKNRGWFALHEEYFIRFCLVLSRKITLARSPLSLPEHGDASSPFDKVWGNRETG